MNGLEQAPRLRNTPDFGMELDMGGFDINTAFLEAVSGVASDTELALEEKVRRMEVIVSEGTSEIYRDFVDFRVMAAQIEMMCSHDHALGQSIQGNETLSTFIDSHRPDEMHSHTANPQDRHKDKDDYEIDPKTGKKTKKKKRIGWFDLFFK